MKKILLIAAVLFATNLVFAQSEGSLTIFGGYGQSAFAEEGQMDGFEVEEAKYVPVGFRVMWGTGNILFGGEVNYAAVPFTFTMNYDGNDYADITFTQLNYGIVTMFRLGSGTGLIPYIRGGAGIYVTSAEIDWVDEINNLGYEDVELEYKDAFGYNAGIGIEFSNSPNSAFIAEIVYHKIDRELDAEGAEKEKGDNLALHIGYKFGF